MKINTCFLALVLALGVTGCAMDNYEEPESTLEGRVVYEGQPINVRQNAIQLELWQSGYAEREYIPVFIKQDGTFNAVLFDGDYKLVRKQNNGPWVNVPDTILVNVSGSKTLDIPVQPFVTVNAGQFQKSGTKVNGTVSIAKVVPTAQIERVVLLVGKTQFVDTRYNNGRVDLEGGAITNLGSVALSLDTNLTGSVFARIGVKMVGVEELIYTPVTKL